MRVSSFVEIEANFIERAHRMVWCDMATVGPNGRPRTRIVHPVWEGDTACMTSLRVGPKPTTSTAIPSSHWRMSPIR